MRSIAALFGVLTAVSAHAAGFYLGENGTKSLLQGGAFTAQSDDLTAMDFNPAGLAQWTGFQVLVDSQLIMHSATFQREDPGFDPNNPGMLSKSVSNSGGPFYLPFVAVGYGLPVAHRKLTFSIGFWGPPSVGRYEYPTPEYDKDGMGNYVANPKRFAPQRYELIKNNIIILYPSLSVGFEAIPDTLYIGVTGQLVYSTVSLSEALYSGLVTPKNQGQEDPIFDSVVNLDLKGQWTATAIVGALYKPTPWLAFGASIRPPFHIHAEGKLDLQLGEAATELGTKVTGDRAALDLQFPLEARVGARVMPTSKLGINIDWVYQGWQSVKELTLTPEDITLQIGAGAPQPVNAFHIPKNWTSSYSFRIGAGYDLFSFLSLHAGFWWERGTASDQLVTIDFMHFDRVFITGGVTVHVGPVDIIGGVAGSPNVHKAVTDSKVTAGSTDSSVPGGVVGDGVYDSSAIIATLGLRAHFGGAPPAPPPAPESSPTPETLRASR